MRKLFNRTSTGLAVLLLGLVGCMGASQAEEYTAGKEYDVISPIPIEQEAGRVNVTELFWYTCPHCKVLEKEFVGQYLKQKADNVDFVQMPAVFSKARHQDTFFAKLFYVVQVLDADGKKNLHHKIFSALHDSGRRLDNMGAVNRFLVAQGFKQADIDAAYQSMQLTAKVNYALQFTQGSGADSVPTIIVNGKYLTSAGKAGGYDKLIKVVNYLTEKESK